MKSRKSNLKLTIKIGASLILIYFFAAYIAAPLAWYFHTKGSLHENAPTLTHTGSGIPGDPINVALIGSKSLVMKAMLTAKWYPANPLTLKSCLEIAEATVFERPYDMAPVSSLYLFGRKEDLAFEKPVGNDPRKRHHVRFWHSDEEIENDVLWYGSVTFDKGVGFSDTTGQITHHISSDIDKERKLIFQDLEDSHFVKKVEVVKNFQKVRDGKNGGGDVWRTDGRLFVGYLQYSPKDPKIP